MENRKRSDDRIIQLITLSEEISNMSVKVKQLIEDLHGTPDVLAGAKEITNSLNGKVAGLQADLNSYQPLAPEKVVDPANPSWQDGVNERERIVPTPQNIQDYMPIREAAPSVPVAEVKVETPTIEATVQTKQTVTKKAVTKKKTATRKQRKSNKPRSGLFGKKQ